jgi:uncharacterized protein
VELEREIDDLAARIREALAPVQDVRLAYLFGSRARGNARPDSDVDIAVAYARGLELAGLERARQSVIEALTEVLGPLRRSVIEALTEALGPLGERADVVDLERAGTAVAFRALREGRRVLVRSEPDRITLEASIGRRYDDEAPRRALFRRAASRLAGSSGARR